MNSSCSVFQWRWLDHAPGAKRQAQQREVLNLARQRQPADPDRELLPA